MVYLVRRFRMKLNKARKAAGLPELPVNSSQKVTAKKEDKPVEKKDAGLEKRSNTDMEKMEKQKESFLEWAPLNLAVCHHTLCAGQLLYIPPFRNLKICKRIREKWPG